MCVPIPTENYRSTFLRSVVPLAQFWIRIHTNISISVTNTCCLWWRPTYSRSTQWVLGYQCGSRHCTITTPCIARYIDWHLLHGLFSTIQSYQPPRNDFWWESRHDVSASSQEMVTNAVVLCVYLPTANYSSTFSYGCGATLNVGYEFIEYLNLGY